MATIDAQIALAGRAPQIDNPMDVYGKALNIRALNDQNRANQMTLEKAARDQEQERTLASLYRGAVGPDGKIDRTRLLSGAAQAGLGGRIPGMEKGFLEIDKAAADIGKVTADTGKVGAETKKLGAELTKIDMENMLKGMQLVDNSIASMAADPAISDVKVASEIGRLVRMGAFNSQAKHAGVSPDEAAKQVLASMPVGNPAALKSWLIQAGMRTADASKRLELMLPKYDEQDRGGTISEGTINMMDGTRTPGTSITKTNTPGEVLSAKTAKETAAMVDARMRDANRTAQQSVDLQKEAARQQIIDTVDGQVIVDKGSKTVTPLRMADGRPIFAKDSKIAEDRKMAQGMGELIVEARRLLNKGPTGSPIGALADKVMSVTGMSTQGMDLAGQLDTLGGWMTSNVPRMQGPQGVQDVILYKQMAATVGDRTIPVDTRLKALDTLETIMRRQGQYTGSTPPVMPPPDAANRLLTPTLPPLDSFYTTPKK